VNFVGILLGVENKAINEKEYNHITRGMVLLLTDLFVGACSSNTGETPGTHSMGSAPMSNAKHPGKPPGQ
jgi:hypothetical protein